ncbi:MAG: thioredoxin domain-containing protein [Deltaproteobacteria bacterium]|nr:thioredoxin domain-containing protein [Deltaproteobacteria bacterium]MBP7292135.1 thioredoxin domain-containing protein [Nannocystaceae bacterium]
MNSAPATIILAIERPGQSVQTVTVTGSRALVGRESGDIVLADAESSAMHAEIDASGAALIVRDLGSSNGTWRGRANAAGEMQWERLPQFALLPGTCFRCGTTIVRLIEQPGGELPAAGRTVVSGSRSGTRLSTDHGVPVRTPAPAVAPIATSAITAVRATPTPSASPTMPGQAAAAPAPAPASVPAPASAPASAVVPSSATLPLFGAAPATTHDGVVPTADASAPAPEGASSTMRAPVPAAEAPVAAAPMATADVPMHAAIAPAPAPSVTVDPARRPPVKNALIRPGDKPVTGPTPIVAPRGPRRWPKRLGFVAAALAVVAALSTLAWWAVRHFGARPPAIARTVAEQFPADALGFVVFAAPETQIGLLGDALPESVRAGATQQWGFDPFVATAWQEAGIDPAAPIAIAWLDPTKPAIAISVGLGDRDKLRAALPGLAAKLAAGSTGATSTATAPEVAVSDRSFGDTAGFWLEAPRPTAVVVRDARAVAVVGLDGADAASVAAHAERIAALEHDTSLAAREGFTALGSEVGDPIVFAYVDGVSMRSAIPANAASLVALRMGFAEIDALSFALLRDDARVRISSQVLAREGSQALRYLDGERSGAALARVPGPALAGLDGAFAAKPIADALIAFANLTGSWTEIESAVRGQAGLELRGDIIDNIAGEAGVVLLALPSKPDASDAAVLGYLRVVDEAKAKASLDAALPALQSKVFDVPASTETIAETAVHTFTVGGEGHELRISLFVAGEHLWLATGTADVRALLERTGKSVHDTARNSVLARATDKGGVMRGFVDVPTIAEKLEPLLDEVERANKLEAEPLWKLLDAVTYGVDVHERRLHTELVVHTTESDGLAALLRAAAKLSGDRAAAAIGRAQRVADCEKLVTHLMELQASDTSRTVAEFALRFEVSDRCATIAKPEQIACALAATSFAEVDACGGAEAGLLPPEPEPQAVPYIDDIWPNTRASTSESGRPRAEVNYGVDVGVDPQIRGRADALVTIIEFGDFQCPYCREVTATLDEVLSRHGNNVRLVFRHNPLPIHPEAKNAARAALAAARQGKFWAMHDKLFESQFELAPDKYRQYATTLGLDVDRFVADMDDPAIARQVEDDTAVARRFGLTGTPSFFVNGRFLSGNQSLAVFDSLVNEELSRARTFVERRGNSRKRLYEDMIARFASEVTKSAAVALPPDTGERFSIATEGLPRRGASGFARVNLTECGDFDCPYCQRATKTLDRIVADYPTQVTVTFLHNPLGYHANAEPAARAAIAADKQGKFWEMHDKLYAHPDAHAQSDFVGYAKELKLDVAQFERDFAAPETAKLVVDQQKICADAGGTSTPTFFLNGRRIEGAQSFETFKALIDAELLGGI